MNTTKISKKIRYLRAVLIVGIVLVTTAYTNAYACAKGIKISTQGLQITLADNTGYWLEY